MKEKVDAITRILDDIDESLLIDGGEVQERLRVAVKPLLLGDHVFQAHEFQEAREALAELEQWHNDMMRLNEVREQVRGLLTIEL